jgi:hypothetical protein
MKRFNRMLNSAGFKKVLVIFIVGLVLRGVLNYIYDIEVFKEYSNTILLLYFGFMGCCLGVVYELPIFSFNLFDIKTIVNSIRIVWEGSNLVDDKMELGGDVSNKTLGNKDVSKDSLVVKQDDPYRKRSSSRRPSAGLGGLYGDNRTNSRRPSAGIRGLYEQSDKRDKSYEYTPNKPKGGSKSSKIKDKIYYRIWG